MKYLFLFLACFGVSASVSATSLQVRTFAVGKTLDEAISKAKNRAILDAAEALQVRDINITMSGLEKEVIKNFTVLSSSRESTAIYRAEVKTEISVDALRSFGDIKRVLVVYRNKENNLSESNRIVEEVRSRFRSKKPNVAIISPDIDLIPMLDSFGGDSQSRKSALSKLKGRYDHIVIVDGSSADSPAKDGVIKMLYLDPNDFDVKFIRSVGLYDVPYKKSDSGIEREYGNRIAAAMIQDWEYIVPSDNLTTIITIPVGSVSLQPRQSVQVFVERTYGSKRRWAFLTYGEVLRIRKTGAEIVTESAIAGTGNYKISPRPVLGTSSIIMGDDW
jgi:hypothetical protein